MLLLQSPECLDHEPLGPDKGQHIMFGLIMSHLAIQYFEFWLATKARIATNRL